MQRCPRTQLTGDGPRPVPQDLLDIRHAWTTRLQTEHPRKGLGTDGERMAKAAEVRDEVNTADKRAVRPAKRARMKAQEGLG